MELSLKNPIQTEAGYFKDDHYYFDVFLASPKGKKPPKPTTYKKFRARLDSNCDINILLTKSQVEELGGLRLQRMIGEVESREEIPKDFTSYPQFIECMLPVTKVSDPSTLFQIQELLQGVQVLEDDEDLGAPDEILVGCEFLVQFGFNIFRHHPKMMHTRTTEEEELQDWVLEFKDLGMYEVEDTDSEDFTKAGRHPDDESLIGEKGDLSEREDQIEEVLKDQNESQEDINENSLVQHEEVDWENSETGPVQREGLSANSKKIKKITQKLKTHEQTQKKAERRKKIKQKKKEELQGIIKGTKLCVQKNNSLGKRKTLKVFHE